MKSAPRPKKQRKKQRERKDKGLPKISMAAEMANVALPLSCHKGLIDKETVCTDDSKSDISLVSETNLNILSGVL